MQSLVAGSVQSVVRCQTGGVKHWVVGGGIIERGQDLLLVRNRRRNGSVDWTTPGGVIDEGESVLGGLSREVNEETGLVVSEWSRHLYTVTVDAPGLGWQLRAEVHLAGEITGDLHVDDPDGIVEEARWVGASEGIDLCRENQRWLAEPLTAWIDDPWADGHRVFDYSLEGSSRETFVVTRR